VYCLSLTLTHKHTYIHVHIHTRNAITAQTSKEVNWCFMVHAVLVTNGGLLLDTDIQPRCSPCVSSNASDNDRWRGGHSGRGAGRRGGGLGEGGSGESICDSCNVTFAGSSFLL
jgi:uncharacterized membrane protein YgcG